MILLGGIKIGKRKHFYHNLAVGLHLLATDEILGHLPRHRVGIINARAVLRAPVTALTVERVRVDRLPVKIQNLRQRNHVGVVSYLHSLRGICRACAHLLVRGRGHCGIGISRLGADHAGQRREKTLSAPKTASGQIYNCGRGHQMLFHNLLWYTQSQLPLSLHPAHKQSMPDTESIEKTIYF